MQTRRWFCVNLAASGLIAGTAARPALAQGVREVAGDRLAAIQGLLDGQVFQAKIVQPDRVGGGSAPLIDRLKFSSGTFSSAICERYNFAAAPYWLRVEGDTVHFRVQLDSPTDGAMLWAGTITGTTLKGTMHWTKKRWY